MFENIDKDNCTLYIPIGTKSLYETADQWKDFMNIVEENATGVGAMYIKGISLILNNRTLIIRNAPVNSNIRVYDLSEQLVYAGNDTTIKLPYAGTHIVNIGNIIRKVLIKYKHSTMNRKQFKFDKI